MPAVYVENIGAHEGNEVTIRGWIYNKRSSGKLQFILLRDGTGVIQCVAFKGNFSAEQFEALDKITQESSIEISGKVRKDARSPGGYELDIADMVFIVHGAIIIPSVLKEPLDIGADMSRIPYE